MSPEKDHYQVAVIGAGQGGGPLSRSFAEAGFKTTLIEREFVGGTCINKGCTPTKTMIASARIAHLTRRASDYGILTPTADVDMEKIRQRKRDIVESFRSGNLKRIKATDDLELIFGDAVFVGDKTVEIRSGDGKRRRLSAERICINTGSSPAIPPIEGMDSVPWMDSTSVMELDIVPKHLLIIGGGYVGSEFAQMFRRFGASVTIIQRGKQLLPREDEDVAEEVSTVFREEGIEVLLSTETISADNGPDGGIRLTLRNAESKTVRTGTHLLVATGRSPNTGDLNLSTTGVELDERRFVRVNDRLETSARGIYALGDVKSGPAFTHISYDDFRILRANLIEGKNRSTTGRIVPYTVFIDPQLGRVGMTEKEARAGGRHIKVAKMPMTHVARALEVDETRGFMKAVVDSDNDQILGCAILGIEGGETAAILQMAMMGRVPYVDIRDGIFAHPTLAESLNNLFLSFPE